MSYGMNISHVSFGTTQPSFNTGGNTMNTRQGFRAEMQHTSSHTVHTVLGPRQTREGNITDTIARTQLTSTPVNFPKPDKETLRKLMKDNLQTNWNIPESIYPPKSPKPEKPPITPIWMDQNSKSSTISQPSPMYSGWINLIEHISIPHPPVEPDKESPDMV
jgi:hypothetical protein